MVDWALSEHTSVVHVPIWTEDNLPQSPTVPTASNQVLIVADACLRLEGGSRATSLQNGGPTNGTFVESVAVLRVGPRHRAGGDLSHWGSSDRGKEHEAHNSIDGLIGEMHLVD